MKKLLLLFAVLLAAVGAKAYNYPGNSSSDVKDYGDGKTVSFYDEAANIQRLVVGAGGLAEWLNDTSASQSSLGSTSRTKLIVTGTMNAEDFAAMSGELWQAFTVVDLSGVTIENQSDISGMALPNAEYLLMPNGYSTTDLAALNTNNPSLKMAGSWDQLTGQTVPGWAQDVNTETVTKFYTDSEYTTEYTAGDQFQNGEDWFGHAVESTTMSIADGTLTEVSVQQTYTNTWADNQTYPVGDLTVTDNQVTPSEFVAKLNYTRTITYNGEPLVESWMSIGNGIEERDGQYYYASWVCNQYGKDPNQPLTVTETFTVAQNGATYDVATNGEPNWVGDVPYGTITNPGGVSFQVNTEYTYSYENCEGNGIEQFNSNSQLTEYNRDCTIDIPLYARDEEISTTLTTQSPTTLEDQTLSQLSLYGFSKDEGYNFASNLLQITNVNSSVVGVDKLCMAGESLGRGDLINTSTSADLGLWQNTKYFDFTGATFADATINIKSADVYNGSFGGEDMTGETNINESVATNEFYYFSAMAGNVLTCVLPTGNTEIPPKTFYTNSGNAYGSDGSPLIEINIPDTYTKIGFEAFNRTKIQTLFIPGSITTIEEGAFADCYLLTNVEMAASNSSCTFGEKAFAKCKEMKFFTMAEGVTGIPYKMFTYCANLESIRIPSTCTNIGDFAFEACASLHSVTIPEGVQTMDHLVFRLSGITDIYVMAKTFESLPRIYNTGIDGNRNGTFSSANLNGNNGTSPDTYFSNGSGSPTNKKYADADSKTVLTYYQENYSSGGYLGSGNCFTYLHFPDEMKWFYDGVPGFQNVNGISDLHTYEYIVDKYPSPNWVDGGGAQWPYDTASSFSSAYHFEDRDADHGGEVNKTWPGRDDMITRRVVGGTETEEQTGWGWRQFSLMNSVSDTGQENFERQYDDTWYTMCFPWRMTDNQLFDTFNQKCEIVEFKGAEVIQSEDDEYTYNLVLHFDEVAGTYYMDDNNNKYQRENDGTYNVNVQGTTVTLNKYKYTLLDASGNTTSTYYTFDTQNAMNNVVYNSIENIMVLAGHPYMIHPSIGANPGSPTTCYITGVKRVAKTDDELADLEDSGTVTRDATTGDAMTLFSGPLGGGKYSFKGYLGRGVYTTEGEDIVENPDFDANRSFGLIPENAYFLSIGDGTSYYPKFYREKAAGGAYKWTTYTAVIIPDTDAIANIEGLDGKQVSNSANVSFGDWEQVEADAIEEIITEAEEKGQEVRRVNMNVVYNVNGQVVRTDGQIEGLPKGLYIVNGKKYMVK